MIAPPLDPALEVATADTLETNEGVKPVVHGLLAGEPVTAIALGERRAQAEAEAITRLREHPSAPASARVLEKWLVVPRMTLTADQSAGSRGGDAPDKTASGDAAPPGQALQSIGGSIRELLDLMSPAPDRGGSVDVPRALRHLELPRGPLDRWLESQSRIGVARGAELGGADPRWLGLDLRGRWVCPIMRRARIDGLPDLDRAARALFLGQTPAPSADPELSLAHDLATIHVGLLEIVHGRVGPVQERARSTVTELVLGRLRALPPRERREPFRAHEPRSVRMRRLFSRFFEGIRFDDEGLYSATPEALALRIALGLSGRVLDGTCGIGSIAIALARSPTIREVVAVDLSRERLEMARHNAHVYRVSHRITFVHGDVRELLALQRFDAVVLDPPWGGRDYDRERVGLSDLGLDPGPLIALHRGPLRIKLPKSFAREELAGFSFEELADERGVVKMLLATR